MVGSPYSAFFSALSAVFAALHSAFFSALHAAIFSALHAAFASELHAAFASTLHAAIFSALHAAFTTFVAPPAGQKLSPANAVEAETATARNATIVNPRYFIIDNLLYV